MHEVKVYYCVNDDHLDIIRIESRPILPVKGTVTIDTTTLLLNRRKTTSRMCVKGSRFSPMICGLGIRPEIEVDQCRSPAGNCDRCRCPLLLAACADAAAVERVQFTTRGSAATSFCVRPVTKMFR